MTPDIQELKRLAEAAKKITPQITRSYLWNDYMRAASPDTILALIEENERLRGHIGVLLDNEPDELAADGGVTVLDVWRKEAVERFRIPVLTEDRTALEGVKK